MKFIYSFAVLLLLMVACQDPAASSTETTDDTVDTLEAPEALANVETLPSGENYRVEVLNDSIKSPRKELMGTIDSVEITINYGSPAVNGRTIYGDLVPYGRVWRTGANEATRIVFGSPVLLGDATEAVPAGTYALFTEPASKEEWTIIINEDAYQWGPYDYTADKDIIRVAGSSTPVEEPAERMDFTLSEDAIQLHWADLTISIPVQAAGSSK